MPRVACATFFLGGALFWPQISMLFSITPGKSRENVFNPIFETAILH